MQGFFRRAVVIFYWIALPVALLLCAGWLMTAAVSPPAGKSLMMAAGSGLFAAAVGWRLWLYSRSLGRGGPLPQTRRLLLVFLPLTLLALAGIGLAALGIVWLALGLWVLLGPEAATSGYRDLVSGPALPIGAGALMTVVGAALVLPLLRRLRTRPRAADSF